MRSGMSLLLTSEVAGHETMTCSIESMEASQSLQAGLSEGWSRARLSFVRKSVILMIRQFLVGIFLEVMGHCFYQIPSILIV